LVVGAARPVIDDGFAGRAAGIGSAVVGHATGCTFGATEAARNIGAAGAAGRAARTIAYNDLTLRAAMSGLSTIERTTLFGGVIAANRVGVATGDLGADITARTEVVAARGVPFGGRTAWLLIEATELISVDIRWAEMPPGRFLTALRPVSTLPGAADLVISARGFVFHADAATVGTALETFRAGLRWIRLACSVRALAACAAGRAILLRHATASDIVFLTFRTAARIALTIALLVRPLARLTTANKA
jgi:hypothetical protein